MEAQGRCGMSLERLLERVPQVYAALGEAQVLPGAGDPEERPAKDPTYKPAPGRPDVIEHRHELLRGLRWWVDAVAVDHRPGSYPVGNSVAHMCALILHNVPHMAPEDKVELAANLDAWLVKAWPYVGRMEPHTRQSLPLEAVDAILPVHAAAKLLGVSVRTVQRRAERTDGLVRLGDVMRCDHGLPQGQCHYCERTTHTLRSH